MLLVWFPRYALLHVRTRIVLLAENLEVSRKRQSIARIRYRIGPHDLIAYYIMCCEDCNIALYNNAIPAASYRSRLSSSLSSHLACHIGLSRIRRIRALGFSAAPLAAQERRNHFLRALQGRDVERVLRPAHEFSCSSDAARYAAAYCSVARYRAPPHQGRCLSFSTGGRVQHRGCSHDQTGAPVDMSKHQRLFAGASSTLPDALDSCLMLKQICDFERRHASLQQRSIKRQASLANVENFWATRKQVWFSLRKVQEVAKRKKVIKSLTTWLLRRVIRCSYSLCAVTAESILTLVVPDLVEPMPRLAVRKAGWMARTIADTGIAVRDAR